MTTFYPTLPYKKFDDGVPDPAYAYVGDAGIDLSVTEDYVLEPGEQRMFGTGLSFAIPEGFAGMVVPRSGLGSQGLAIANTMGIIDSNYRGEVKLQLVNKGDEPLMLFAGNRVVQMLIVAVAQCEMVKVETLSDTERGTRGFGSSGTGRL